MNQITVLRIKKGLIINMEILYNQLNSLTVNQVTIFSSHGIEQCYFKHKLYKTDFCTAIHHHSGYELHYITEGCQQYKVENQIYSVRNGEFLILPPYVKHKLLSNESRTTKYSITFSLDVHSHLNDYFSLKSQYAIGTISPQIAENIYFITLEHKQNKEISNLLIANRLFETIFLSFREAGAKEYKIERHNYDEDSRVTLAKQYINDNVESLINVEELAKYCSLSSKQLARLFIRYEHISISSYIAKQRVRYIEILLADSTLSLSTISERMNFSNEYYFNSFFKKHAGLPPGKYRNMILSKPDI